MSHRASRNREDKSTISDQHGDWRTFTAVRQISIEAFHFLLNEPFTSTVRLDLNHGYEIQWMNRRFALGSNLSLHKVQTCFQGSTPFNSADLLAVT
ncbi:MAG: hypothetical protein OXF84_03860 [Bacteroidetes bacterium]|nr:hypothetical protein [Bacteroidota bacterium]